MTISPRLAFFSTVATFAYLGLAVLGWGGFATFFSHPSLIALTIALLAMSGAGLFSAGTQSSGEHEDRANRWVLAVFALIGLLAAFLPAYTDRIGFWTLDGDSIRWLGVSSSPPVVSCGSGQSLCSATGSADWSPSSPDIDWSRLVSMVSSATPAIWGLLVNSLGVGPRFSFRRRRGAHGAHYPPAPRAHRRGRSAAALALRRRIRCLLQPYVAADFRALLRRRQSFR